MASSSSSNPNFPLPGAVPAQPLVEPPSSDRKVLDLVKNEDVFKLSGQNYAIISVVARPENAAFALKIRGVADTLEEAEKHAKQLAAIDPFFDGALGVMVGEGYN